MARVFISYSRRNAKTAEKVAARLREAGHYPWIDSAELLVGDSIADAIQQAIETCGFLCFLVTKASLKSTWAREEVSSALSRQLQSKAIRVLPILADKSIGNADLPPFLADKKYASFRHGFEKGMADLLKALGAASPIPDASTDVTIFLRDLMETAIAIIRNKFPDYRIVGIRDRDDATRDWLGCSGNIGNCDIEWLFDLERQRTATADVPRMTAHVHPIFDILMGQFPEAKEIMLWTTEKVKESVHERVKQIEVAGIDCSALDAEVILFRV